MDATGLRVEPKAAAGLGAADVDAARLLGLELLDQLRLRLGLLGLGLLLPR